MSDGVALYRIYDLPWSTGAEDERKFHKIVRAAIAAALVLGALFWLLPMPRPDVSQAPEVPKRIVKLVLEREAPPPPPPPVVREEPKPEPKSEPVVEQRKETPKPEPKVEPKPEPKPVDRTQQARERASVAGLLPFAQQLAALRDDTAAAKLDQKQIVGSTAEGATPLSERSLITSRVGTASGGINTAALSRNTGGSGLAGRSTTQVESPVEAVAPPGGAAQRTGASDKASRSREEIERTFDKYKGAIYSLYNRALRANPTLQGKVVLKLTISPAGKVTSCEVVSSELGDPDLEQKLVQRVLLFEFEQRDVETITTTKPIDFFPA
jgi:TonB family protein